MRKLIVVILIALSSCMNAPKNFTYHYINSDTGLSSKINIDGYYVTQHGCDSSFYSIFMFYPDGLFTIATTSDVSQELIDCFEQGGKSTLCQYPLWGQYRLVGDTIKTQTIRPEGGGCVVFRDYLITPNKQIINFSDYVESQLTSMGYMKNYPSFKENECGKVAIFSPIKARRDANGCPFLDKKWFK